MVNIFTKTKMILSKIFLLIIFFSVFFVGADSSVERDVEISVILENPDSLVEHDKLFRAENLDHESGVTDSLDFFVNASIKNLSNISFGNNSEDYCLFYEDYCLEKLSYNFSDYNYTCDESVNGSVNESVNESNCSEDDFCYSCNCSNFLHDCFSDGFYYSWNATRSINRFSETNMGSLFFVTGKYELCVELIPLNFFDPDLSNNYVCETILTSDYEVENDSVSENEDFCDCPLSLITDKDLYELGESVNFVIDDCSNNDEFENEVEYWFEDLFDEIVRNKVITTSKNPKSYTPDFDSVERAFILKTKFEECDETFYKIVNFKNKDYQKSTFFNLSSVNEANPGDVIILELNGYKHRTLKTLINIQLELDEKRKSNIFKVYIPKQESDFNFRMPFFIPSDLPVGTFDYNIVAEGLGVEFRKSISISKEEEIKEEEIKKESVGKINNFYTRKRNFDGSLNVVINWEGYDGAIIKVTSQNESVIFNALEKIVNIPLKINKHDELLVAELIKNDETIDFAILKLDLELPDSENSENDNEKSEEINEVKENEDEDNKEEDLVSDVQGSLKDKNDSDVLEAGKEKVSKGITSMAISYISSNGKQAVFFLLGALSLFFLFKKEIFEQIKKFKKQF